MSGPTELLLAQHNATRLTAPLTSRLSPSIDRLLARAMRHDKIERAGDIRDILIINYFDGRTWMNATYCDVPARQIHGDIDEELCSIKTMMTIFFASGDPEKYALPESVYALNGELLETLLNED